MRSDGGGWGEGCTLQECRNLESYWGVIPPTPPTLLFLPSESPSLDWLPLGTMTGPHNRGHRPGASLLQCLHLWLGPHFLQPESVLLELRL